MTEKKRRDRKRTKAIVVPLISQPPPNQRQGTALSTVVTVAPVTRTRLRTGLQTLRVQLLFVARRGYARIDGYVVVIEQGQGRWLRERCEKQRIGLGWALLF